MKHADWDENHPIGLNVSAGTPPLEPVVGLAEAGLTPPAERARASCAAVGSERSKNQPKRRRIVQADARSPRPRALLGPNHPHHRNDVIPVEIL